MTILNTDIQYEIENVDYNEKFDKNRASLIYIPKISFLDKSQKRISCYGGDMIEFSYNNQFDLSDHSLSVNIFNALSHFLTESTIPFIKRTCDGKNSMTESTCTKDTDYAYLFGFCKYYPSFIKNINNIIQIINSKDYFKNTLLWFSYSIESELKLDKFLHYYRVIEVLSNNYHSEKIKKIQLFIDRELKEFPNLAPHNILSNKDRLSYFLKIKGVDEKTIKTIDELRNKKIAHGTDATLEVNPSIAEINNELKVLCRKLICQELNLKIEELNFIQREYFYYHKTESNEVSFISADKYADIALKDSGERSMFSLDHLSEEKIIELFKINKITIPSLDDVLFSKRHYNMSSIERVWMK